MGGGRENKTKPEPELDLVRGIGTKGIPYRTLSLHSIPKQSLNPAGLRPRDLQEGKPGPTTEGQTSGSPGPGPAHRSTLGAF